jgi:aminomethyltransferase
MKPGDWQYTFFLNAQGQIQADAYLICFEDHFLLDVEPQTRQSVYEHLDRFIIADDVTLEDVTGETYCFGVEGPLASGEGFPISYTGARALRSYGALADKESARAALHGSGVIEATADDAETCRIMHFMPRYGHDITERSLPQETRQMEVAVHTRKGCYLGQEIVERVRSRGHINRLLAGFTGDSDHAPETGAKIAYGGKEDGEVTSAVAVDGKFYGLAIVRSQIAAAGTVVGIDGRPATLTLPHVIAGA